MSNYNQTTQTTAVFSHRDTQPVLVDQETAKMYHWQVKEHADFTDEQLRTEPFILGEVACTEVFFSDN